MSMTSQHVAICSRICMNKIASQICDSSLRKCQKIALARHVLHFDCVSTICIYIADDTVQFVIAYGLRTFESNKAVQKFQGYVFKGAIVKHTTSILPLQMMCGFHTHICIYGHLQNKTCRPVESKRQICIVFHSNH